MIFKFNKCILLPLVFGLFSLPDFSFAAESENSTLMQDFKEVRMGEPRNGWDFSAIRSIPVLSGGRWKPFDTLSREWVLELTGRREFAGWDSVDLTLSWIAFAEHWSSKPFLLIQNKDLKRQIGVDEKESRFSPALLFENSYLGQYIHGLDAKNQSLPISRTSKPDAREAELKRLVHRIELYQALVSDTGRVWEGLYEQKTAFFAVILAYRSGNQDLFTKASEKLAEAFREKAFHEDPSLQEKNDLEVRYNHWRPLKWAWISYFLAGLIASLGLVLFRKGNLQELSSRDLKGFSLLKSAYRGSQVFLALGFALHIAGMGLRSWIAGRPPVTNMYESIVWVSFGVVLFSVILFFLQRKWILIAVGSVLGWLGLIVADAAPAMMDPNIHPLMPVLRSNLWLTVHVLTITISYAAFALSMGLGNLALFSFAKSRKVTQPKALELNTLAYRAMQYGVVLLAAGTILGGVWADYSWGRFWGWDPKEVWALIALLGYLAVLHARFTGWMKAFGFAAWTVLSFSLVLMAWYGVNFILGAGLHSYGFSSGGQGWVAGYLILQWGYVGWAKWRVSNGKH